MSKEITVHELVYESEVIGYRVVNQLDNKVYDLDMDLFQYAYTTWLNHFRLKLGFVFICFKSKSGGYYYTASDCHLNPNELETCLDVDIAFSGINFLDVLDREFMYNRLLFRYLICRGMLLSLGIPLGKVDALNVNSKMSSSWGYCHQTGYNHFSIDIAERLMISADDSGVDLVVIHELLHTCKDCFNHGAMWKHYGNTVCNSYGFNITRLTSAEEVNSDSVELIKQGYYACQCLTCGKVISKKTECRFIKHPEYYSCGVCGGAFIRIS